MRLFIFKGVIAIDDISFDDGACNKAICMATIKLLSNNSLIFEAVALNNPINGLVGLDDIILRNGQCSRFVLIQIFTYPKTFHISNFFLTKYLALWICVILRIEIFAIGPT